jgi:hypothetical protein
MSQDNISHRPARFQPASRRTGESAETPASIFQDAVNADVVHIEQAGAGVVEAHTVNVSQGGIQTARAEVVQIEQGGIGQANAGQITIAQGGVGMAQARRIDIQESQVGVMAADTVDARSVRTGLLFARQVNGDVQTVITQQTAAIFALISGLTIGAILLLLRRR